MFLSFSKRFKVPWSNSVLPTWSNIRFPCRLFCGHLGFETYTNLNREKILPSACHSVEVLVLGDFNFRKACWDTGSSTLSDEQSLIDFLCVETSLVQIIDSPTHKSGNILDLAFFSHEHKWSYTVLERDMSDHSPVILITDVVMTLENHETQFSFAQFNYSLFKEVLVMNRALAESCHSQNPFFLFQWFQLLDHAMQLSLPRKRQKRLQLPFFYSSQTVHQINKLRSAERRSAPTAILQKLSSDIATLIEMDKTVILRNFTTYITHDAFALLRKLNNNASYPSTMTYGSLSVNNTLAKADLFNRFFCSVYIESNEETVLPQADNPSIFLSDLCFSVEIIQKYLENVPRSNKPAADGIPPVLLNTMSEHLAPFVYLHLPTYRQHSVGPISGNAPLLHQFTKKEAVVMFKITDQSRFYPGSR